TFQNRFIADAAHQLRTPVAGLKAHIELALREEDPAHARQSLAHLYTAVERISRLVSQLLSLARNEPNTVKKLELAAVDLAERVFERFHRLLGSHTGGSGLGLAIVREIAALHQAEITLEDDADGVGNRFTVAFPPAAAA